MLKLIYKHKETIVKQKHCMLVLFFLTLNIIGRTWKVPKLHINALYTIAFNLLYYYLCKRHLLWEFNTKGVNWKVLRAIHIFFITPSMVALTLSEFPVKFYKKILHFVFAIGASTVMDYTLVKRKILKFKRGWSVKWSCLLYLKMYVYNYLLQKRPILVLILSFLSTVTLLITFKVPLTSRLIRGPIILLKKKKIIPFECNLPLKSEWYR